MNFDVRAALRFGAFGATIVFVPLAGLVLFVSGMSDCVDCDTTPFLLYGWGLAALLATAFGLLTGSVVALIASYLDAVHHDRKTSIVLMFVILLLAFPTLWVAPSLYTYVSYLQTPRDQLPPNDPRRTGSECARTKLPANVVCGH